ncbi:uncharacterized protein SAPINGB_P001994 [Magnusiomyces paraingens]|uniref:tRNA dimethylallyltransferase n=1 Tax=Magnusiomyces paraingens TaxID=2606893 RepID=A0A5E8BC77_9ASCO|nr:uncharacterized protein SAPINGB_P001994 [Saprochaete ingens]VVT48877.1 unnamed protein product [Saprochaete ingens]
MTTSVPRNLIAIIGTTGVGKSQFSIELAKALNGEIINGDSMQVYRGLDAITNKHPIPERENIPHHLLGHVPWADEYSVQQFEREALQVIDDVYARGKLPILVGGTHYYNQAVIFKNSTLTESPGTGNYDERELTEEQLKVLDGPTRGIIDELKIHDPLVAQKFHPNDGRRLRRALEVFYTTGKKTSDLYLQQKNENEGNGNGDGEKEVALDARFRTLVFWIWSEQTQLNKRLDDRVDAMLNNSLYSEIDEMYEEYLKRGGDEETPDLTKGVWQVIGFRQFLPWLSSGKVSSGVLSECVEEMKRATRKYSKQQTKFMKNTLMPKINTVIERNKKEYSNDHNHDHNYNNHNSIVATILDATDLSQWSDKVAATGIKIAHEFVTNQVDNCILVDESDNALRELLVTPKQFDESQWQTFTCNVCENSEGQKYVAVGEAQWGQHLKSRKHKGTLSRVAKMKRNAEEMAKRGIVKKKQKKELEN